MKLFSVSTHPYEFSANLIDFKEDENTTFTCELIYNSLNKDFMLNNVSYTKYDLQEFSINLEKVLKGVIIECSLIDNCYISNIMIRNKGSYFSIILNGKIGCIRHVVEFEQKADYFLINSIKMEIKEFLSVF
ncbi:hypothetical protein [Virgibacillus proomii]|uniref:hypothetical protein n=1 Tax=Virgibacillus proomii TaxID=84407 RepID=UPI001C121409|nr:hypothetical protein [Virgibacillus proomii]MBU5267068.1 hypothetical protein [Virgibacillus proomii]